MAAQTSQPSSKTAAPSKAATKNTTKKFEADGGPQHDVDADLETQTSSKPSTRTKATQTSSEEENRNTTQSFHAFGGPQMDIDDDSFSEDEDMLSEIDIELGPFRPMKPYETRANHFVRADSEDFQDIENYYKSLLNTPKLTIEDVLEGCFNDHEISLITPQTSPPALVRWQYHNSLRYRDNLKRRFEDRKSTNEFKMACLYFGLPVEPIHMSSEPWEPSPALMVDEMAEPNVDPLKFLQEYDEKYKYPQLGLIEDDDQNMYSGLFGLRGGGDVDVSDSEYDDDIDSLMSLDSVQDEFAAPRDSQPDATKSSESRLPAPEPKPSKLASLGNGTNPPSTMLFGAHTKADDLPRPAGRQPAPTRPMNGSSGQSLFGSGVGAGSGRASSTRMPEAPKPFGGPGPREKLRRLIAEDEKTQTKITATDVNTAALENVFEDSKNDHFEATRRELLRNRAFWTSQSIFTNPQKPVMPLHGPPLESIIKTGPSMPGVSIAMMTPTEMARLQREVHSLRAQLLDRIRECPYADCPRYFPFSDGAGLDKHVREEHSVMRCFLCNEDEHLIPHYNADQIKQHFQNVHLNRIVSSFGGRDGRINNLEDLIGDSTGLEHYCDRCGRDQFALGHPADRSAHSDLCFTRTASNPPKAALQKFCGHCAHALELAGKGKDGRVQFADPCPGCLGLASGEPQKFCPTCAMRFDENMDQNYRAKHTKMCRPVSGRNWDYCLYCGSDLRNLQEHDRKRHVIFCEHKPKNDHGDPSVKGRKASKDEKKCELFRICGALITHMSSRQLAAHMDSHRKHGDLGDKGEGKKESNSYHQPTVESDKDEPESLYRKPEETKGGEDLISYTRNFEQYLDQYIPRRHKQNGNGDEFVDLFGEGIGKPGQHDINVNFLGLGKAENFIQRKLDKALNRGGKEGIRNVLRKNPKKNKKSRGNVPAKPESDEEPLLAKESDVVNVTDAQDSATNKMKKDKKDKKPKNNTTPLIESPSSGSLTGRIDADGFGLVRTQSPGSRSGQDIQRNDTTLSSASSRYDDAASVSDSTKTASKIEQAAPAEDPSHAEGTSSLWTQNTNLTPDPALTTTTVKIQKTNPRADAFVPKPKTVTPVVRDSNRRFPLVPGSGVVSAPTSMPENSDDGYDEDDPKGKRPARARPDRKGKGRVAFQSPVAKKPSPKKNKKEAPLMAGAFSSAFGEEEPESVGSSRTGTPEVETTASQISLAKTKTSSEPAAKPPVEYEELDDYIYPGETKVTLPSTEESGTRTLLPDDELFTARWSSDHVTGEEAEMEAHIAYYGARDLNIDLIHPKPSKDAILIDAQRQAQKTHLNELIETAKSSKDPRDVRELVRALVKNATQKPDGTALAAQVLSLTGHHIPKAQALEYAATPEPDSPSSVSELATPHLSEDQASELSDSAASLSTNSLSTDSHASSDATYDPSRPFPTIASLSSKRKRKRPADIDPQYRKKSIEPDTEYEYSEKSAVPDPVKNIAPDAPRSPKKRATRKKNVTTTSTAEEGKGVEEVKGDMGPPPLPAKAAKAKAEKEKKGPTVTRTGRTVKKTRAAKEANGEETSEAESEVAPARGKGRGKK
ncbi:hypothetical protein GGR57DRAFT_507494 [Xylariaceae sp. FL1272]|nr:hypothetical protein GGR57DRAFT_507494 [Xylariaceae sp. FL1272]